MPHVLLLLLALLDPVMSAQDDPTAVLLRLREQVTAHGQRIPNHTCVETIQRDRFQPVGSPPRSCDALLARRKKSGPGAFLKAGLMDRLRLDVALTEGREIYSWAGAARFEDGDIDQLILEGPIGTGPFASMLLGIFQPRNPRFFYDGESTVRGRNLMQFSFIVAQEESDYRAKAGADWVITGYTGELLVEPGTATLVRLMIRTDELPPATHACEVDTTLEYTTVQLGGLGYLLPKETRQRFIGPDGSEAENAITFTGCREYGAESTVSFGGSSAAGKDTFSATPAASSLPAGILLAAELTAAVELDQAAAGDRIEGRLASPLLDADKKTLAPAGARLEGRLMRVETRYSSPRETTVAVRWETLERDGVRVPLALNPVRTATTGLKVNTPLNGTLRRRVGIDLPMPGEGRYAILHLNGDHPLLKSGLKSDWITITP